MGCLAIFQKVPQLNFFGLFAATYCSVTLFFTLGFSIRSQFKYRWLPSTVAAFTLVFVFVSVGFLNPDRNVVIVFGILLLDQTSASLFIAYAASLTGLIVSFVIFHSQRPWQRHTYLAVYCISACVVVLSPTLVPFRSFGKESTSTKFIIEEYAELTLSPTAIAVGPDDKVYVAGYVGQAHQSSNVVRLESIEGTSGAQEVLVNLALTRVQGIAFFGPDLYLSRCGQYARAVGGRFEYELTVAITRAQDLDGDGTYEYFTDVVVGIPGGRHYHQVNNIAFDSEGTLYITVGGEGENEPLTHPWEGSILRSDWEGKPATIFAQGFRNPYGICVGPGGEVFCTDNDVGPTGKGDDLNHVIEGNHYGHPYTSLDITTKVAGTSDSMLDNISSAPQGLCYVPPGGMESGLDDSLYIVLWNGSLLRVKLQRSANTYKVVKREVVAKMPEGTVDVTLGPDGALYACNFDQKKVFRLTPVKMAKSPQP